MNERIKKIIDLTVEDKTFKTLGELMGMYFIEDACGLYKDNDIQKTIYEDLKKLIPVWKEKYEFDYKTPLTEILKIL